MTRDIERDIFQVIQGRQAVFIKTAVVTLVVSGLFVVLSVYFRWPLFLALIPLALTGPFVVNVASARCPHCQRRLHRNFWGVFRPLVRCARCGFPR
jgi:hypothetical protein